jgi:hypothetical protein
MRILQYVLPDCIIYFRHVISACDANYCLSDLCCQSVINYLLSNWYSVHVFQPFFALCMDSVSV